MELARAFEANLKRFHVVELEPGYNAYGLTAGHYPALYEFQEEGKRRAGAKPEQLLARVRATVPNASSQLSVGSPLHEIAACANDGETDFLAIGSHGHGLIASLLLGSVAGFSPITTAGPPND